MTTEGGGKAEPKQDASRTSHQYEQENKSSDDTTLPTENEHQSLIKGGAGVPSNKPEQNDEQREVEPTHGGNHAIGDREVLDHEFRNHDVNRNDRGETDRTGETKSNDSRREGGPTCKDDHAMESRDVTDHESGNHDASLRYEGKTDRTEIGNACCRAEGRHWRIARHKDSHGQRQGWCYSTWSIKRSLGSQQCGVLATMTERSHGKSAHKTLGRQSANGSVTRNDVGFGWPAVH